MQIGGVGGHSEQSHHITNIFPHSHAHTDKERSGSMSSMSANTSSGTTTAQQESFSLAEWIADPFKSAKKWFGRMWHDGDAGIGSAANGNGDRENSGGEQIIAGIAEDRNADAMGSSLSGSTNGQPNQQTAPPAHTNTLHNPQIAAAATAIQSGKISDNPYFSAFESNEKQSQTIWQRAKVRFRAATGFLMKKFSFSSQNSFQAKQEQNKEDLRKRSHYRGEDLDIDCVLTDDSYLMDSYDRRGQYSRLSAQK